MFCSVPPNYYTYLTPEVTEADKPLHVYVGTNVDAINALVELLQYQLTKTTVSYISKIKIKNITMRFMGSFEPIILV